MIENILFTLAMIIAVAIIATLALSRKSTPATVPDIINPGNTVNFYGFGDTKVSAYQSGQPGTLECVNGIYYKFRDTRADDGVYVTYWANSYDGCRFMRLLNGELAEL